MGSKILKSSILFSLMIFGMFLFTQGNYALAVSGAGNGPIFSFNATSNTSYQYTSNGNYGFQINITNETGSYGSIGNITFELGRPNGILTNYTNYTMPAGMLFMNYTNLSVINFTQNQIGSAGTYNFTWYANDTEPTSGKWNMSQTVSFVIPTGTLNMVITGSSSITTTETGSVTGTESNNAVENDVNYSLSLDGIIFQTLTAPTTMSDIRYLNTGTRTYRFNSTGGQNWSINNTGVTFVVTVNYVTGGGSGGGTPGPTPQLAQVTTILPNGTQITIDTNTQATPQIMQAAQETGVPAQPVDNNIIWTIIILATITAIGICYFKLR